MGLGIAELVLVLAIILLIFGAGKLPKVMGEIGRGIKNLKNGLKEENKEQKNLEDSKKDKDIK
jgi:sec-independent protein translocase protein TatA